MDSKPKHIGRNISLNRVLRDMKQDVLVFAMGISQQTNPSIENSSEL